ncbi:MAG: helix-turn-helix transcriptional regulator [Acidimicrobiales bacterium]
MADNLVTTGQIGESLGVTHTRVADIIRNAEDFPDPEVVLPNGTRLWRREVALRWLEKHPRRKYERRSDAESMIEDQKQ